MSPLPLCTRPTFGMERRGRAAPHAGARMGESLTGGCDVPHLDKRNAVASSVDGHSDEVHIELERRLHLRARVVQTERYLPSIRDTHEYLVHCAGHAPNQLNPLRYCPSPAPLQCSPVWTSPRSRRGRPPPHRRRSGPRRRPRAPGRPDRPAAPQKLAAEPQIAGKKRERVFFTEETRDGAPVIVERTAR